MTRHVRNFDSSIPGSLAAAAHGVLMSREVCDHRWHFSTAMRSVGARLAGSAKLETGTSRSPGYRDFTGGDGHMALAHARTRASWLMRPNISIVLVSPGPALAQLLGLASAASVYAIVVVDVDDVITDACLDSLEGSFVSDGEDLVSIPGRPLWPRALLLE